MSKPIKVIFFDVGETLGHVDLATKVLEVFPPMRDLLQTLSTIFHARMGVITDIPDDWTTDDVRNLLNQAGVGAFFDHQGIITSKDAAHSKGEGPAIFQYAASKFQVEPSACFFADDNPQNVKNACAAGMSAIQKS
jgi:FMN phosphatase YigB (HAD superfamily)